jgi:type IV pilus assembly protein PilA
MITKLNAGMSERNEKGFTLIELMIVIAIIGILAAIAIPQFSAYRVRAYNASAEADVRNLATSQEAYFVDHSKYTNTNTDLNAYGYQASANVTPTLTVDGTSTSYTIKATNSKGNKTYTLNGPGGTITGN